MLLKSGWFWHFSSQDNNKKDHFQLCFSWNNPIHPKDDHSHYWADFLMFCHIFFPNYLSKIKKGCFTPQTNKHNKANPSTTNNHLLVAGYNGFNWNSQSAFDTDNEQNVVEFRKQLSSWSHVVKPNWCVTKWTQRHLDRDREKRKGERERERGRERDIKTEQSERRTKQC